MLHDSPLELDDELEHVPGLSLDQRLDTIQREIHRQGKSIRTTQRGFTIFAVLALLISGVMLITVAIKLDKTSTAAAPAVPATAPATGNPAIAAALPSTVTERLTEMKITGSAATVAAGKVTFNVTNSGKVMHEMVVLQTPTAAGKLPTSGVGRADETGNVGETGDMNAGVVKKLTLNLKPGHYALICNLPGHYTGGMFTDLTVK